MTRLVAAIGLAVLSLGTMRGAAVSGTYHGVRYLMGTWCDLTILDAPSEHAAAAAEAAFQEIARLERVMSTWDAESEISRINGMAGMGPQAISPDLAEVIGASLETCRASGGAFDPTVGPLLALWRFNTERPTVPTSRALADARTRVGCGKVSLRRDPPSVQLPRGASLDLGGIGKGYAVDRALEVLRALGVHLAKLDFGSSSLAFEGHVDGDWPVVLADPRDRDRPLASFRVERGSVSSSGQYERAFMRNGRRYGHIFDPMTGRPVESNLLLVSVIAPGATQADALSTALVVLGSARGAQLVSQMPGVGAIFVEAGPGGRVTLRTAGDVRQLVRFSS